MFRGTLANILADIIPVPTEEARCCLSIAHMQGSVSAQLSAFA